MARKWEKQSKRKESQAALEDPESQASVWAQNCAEGTFGLTLRRVWSLMCASELSYPKTRWLWFNTADPQLRPALGLGEGGWGCKFPGPSAVCMRWAKGSWELKVKPQKRALMPSLFLGNKHIDPLRFLASCIPDTILGLCVHTVSTQLLGILINADLWVSCLLNLTVNTNAE